MNFEKISPSQESLPKPYLETFPSESLLEISHLGEILPENIATSGSLLEQAKQRKELQERTNRIISALPNPTCRGLFNKVNFVFIFYL